MSDELRIAVIGALIGGAFALLGVALQYLLTAISEGRRRKGEFRSLLLSLGWDLQVLKDSIKPKDPTVRFNLASLTWIVDRGFLGSLPAKLRDAVLAIDSAIQIGNDLSDVIGPRLSGVTVEALRREFYLEDYFRRREDALRTLRLLVPGAIAELHQFLPTLGVEVSIDRAPERPSGPVADSPSIEPQS